MAYRYEVTIDSALAAAFREGLTPTLEKAGFALVLQVDSPEAPSIMEFRRGRDIVSLTVAGQMGQKETTIVLASDTVDLDEFVASAVKDAIRDILIKFLTPLGDVSQETLDMRICASLYDICRGTDLEWAP